MNAKQVIRSLIALIFLANATSIIGQELEKQVISSGAINTANGLSINSTVGELSIAQYELSDLTFSEGFSAIIVTIEEVVEPLSVYDFQVKIQPNPVIDLLVINAQQVQESFSYKVHDLKGNLLLSESLLNEKSVDFSTYSKGIYFLKIYDSKNLFIQSFKIIKQ